MASLESEALKDKWGPLARPDLKASKGLTGSVVLQARTVTSVPQAQLDSLSLVPEVRTVLKGFPEIRAHQAFQVKQHIVVQPVRAAKLVLPACLVQLA